MTGRRRRAALGKRGHLLTERRNRRTTAVDRLPLSRAFALMNAEDASVHAAVARARGPILRTIRAVERAWRRGGRLIYVGAGTSGRLGVLDAAECPPTFCSDPKMVRGLIAGGRKALWRSVEGAEDDCAAGRKVIRQAKVSHRDVILGIASGGTTPFVHAALQEARRRKATTAFLACVPRRQVRVACDIDIRLLTGPEVLTGSTRLKAGTATKLTLNMITTLGMVRLGKTYGNLMVDLNSYACRKLVDRATRVVATATGCSISAAARLLRQARGRAKTAIVMHRRGCPRAAAEALLTRHGGRLAVVLDSRSA
jgi:N-acetylmuramic acid 6-phosphate etherase